MGGRATEGVDYDVALEDGAAVTLGETSIWGGQSWERQETAAFMT